MHEKTLFLQIIYVIKLYIYMLFIPKLVPQSMWFYVLITETSYYTAK